MAQSVGVSAPLAAPARSRGLSAILATADDLAPLLARVTLGAVMFPHGAQKLLGWFGGYGFAGTMGFFTSKMGIPAPLAFLVIMTEFFGALALLTGLMSRLSALAIGVTMLVAGYVNYGVSGSFFMNWFGNQKGEGVEYFLLALGLAAIVVVRGGGKWSLDAFLTRSSRT